MIFIFGCCILVKLTATLRRIKFTCLYWRQSIIKPIIGAVDIWINGAVDIRINIIKKGFTCLFDIWNIHTVGKKCFVLQYHNVTEFCMHRGCPTVVLLLLL